MRLFAHQNERVQVASTRKLERRKLSAALPFLDISLFDVLLFAFGKGGSPVAPWKLSSPQTRLWAQEEGKRGSAEGTRPLMLDC